LHPAPPPFPYTTLFRSSIRALLAALPCFAPITQDGTAWALVYFGLIHRAGVGRYVGGTGAITDALERCFVNHGGQTRCSTVVEEDRKSTRLNSSHLGIS